MKKKIRLMSIFTAAAMSVSALAINPVAFAASSAEDAAAAGEIDENFEGVAVGEIPSGWYKSVDADSTNSVGVVDEAGNKVICLDASEVNKEVRLDTPVFDFDKFTVSYKIKFDSAAANQSLLLAGAYGDNYAINHAIHFNVAVNAFRFKKSSSDNGVYATAEADRWYDVKLMVDNTTHMVEFWLDGTFVKKGNFFRNETPVKELIFDVKDSTATKIYIDDLKVQNGYTATSSVEFDFNSAISNNPDTFGPSGVFIQANNSADTDISIVTGKFGKASDDGSLYINNKETATGKDFLVQADLTQTAANSVLSVGETAVLDARVAFDESMSEINFKTFAYSEETTGDGKLGTEFIQLKKDGTLTVFGQATFKLNMCMEPNVWHDIHLEINAGDNTTDTKNTYQVWFDGKALNDTPAAFVLKTRDSSKVQAERSCFRGLQKIWINHNFANNSAAGGFYVDDLRYTVSSESLGVPSMSMTSTNERLNSYINYPCGIFADDSISFSDLEAINVDGGRLAAIRDADGNALTAGSPLTGSYIDVVPENVNLDLVNYDCRHVYMPVRTMSYKKTIDGNEMVMSSSTADTAKAGEWVENTAVKGTDSYTAKAGIGGKASDDYAFQIVSGTDIGVDYLNYSLQGSNEAMPQNYLPMTMEYSFYIEDDNTTLYTLLYFDGSIYGSQVQQAAKTKGGFLSYDGANPDAVADLISGWNRLAITTYPGHDYIDVYLNGQLLGKSHIGTYSYINMIRFAVENQPTGKITALDDFVFYTGAYKSEEPVEEEKAVYYNNAQLLDSNGIAVSVDNVSEGTYTYKISNIENKTLTSQPIVLIAAVYDNDNKLHNIAISDAKTIDVGAAEAELSVSLTVPSGLTNAKIRVFTWNNMQYMTPVTLVPKV